MSIGRVIFWFNEVSSTMDTAHQLAYQGFPHGTIIVARQQRKGRGRNNRIWVSPIGGLWFSIILRPRRNHNLNLLPIVFAIAVHDTLTGYIKNCWIKWPNDIYVNKRKIAGILSESCFTGSSLNHIIVGIGVNINNEVKDFLREKAVSLIELLGHEVSIGQFFEKLVSKMNRYYTYYLESPRSIVDEFNKRTRMINRVVKVIYPDKVLEGTSLGINIRGELIINTSEGLLSLSQLSNVLRVLL